MSKFNHWREAGEPDPFGTKYDCGRIDLPMGEWTDDEIANAYKFSTAPERLEVMADRIRWLSRQLWKAQNDS